MAKQIVDKSVALFKYGGSAVAADNVTIAATPFLSPDVKSQEYKEVGTGKLGQTKSYVDEHNTTVAFDLEVLLRGHNKAADNLDTPPKISELLKACGLTETPTLDTDVTYTPNHDHVDASQAVIYMDGYKRVVDGAVCNMKISGNVGEAAKAVFTVNGYTTPAAVADPNPTVTNDTESLLIVSKVTAITLAGTAVNIESFEFDLGNEIKNNYATGLAEFLRTDFKPTINLSGIKTKGDESGWEDLISNGAKEIIIVLGTAAGKKCTITATQAKTSEMSESDSDGMVNFSRTFRLEGDANGDNHFSIKWH